MDSRLHLPEVITEEVALTLSGGSGKAQTVLDLS